MTIKYNIDNIYIIIYNPATRTSHQNKIRSEVAKTSLSGMGSCCIWHTEGKNLGRRWKGNTYPLPHFPKEVSCLLSRFIKYKQNPN